MLELSERCCERAVRLFEMIAALDWREDLYTEGISGCFFKSNMVLEKGARRAQD